MNDVFLFERHHRRSTPVILQTIVTVLILFPSQIERCAKEEAVDAASQDHAAATATPATPAAAAETAEAATGRWAQVSQATCSSLSK